MFLPSHNSTQAHTLPEGHRRWLLALLLASVALTLSSLALGAELLSLDVELEGDTKNAAAIREAIGRELSVPIDESGPTLRLVVEGTSATMTFVDPEKGPVERTIELPEMEQERIEVLALLAGNLVRDQSFDVAPRDSTAATATSLPTAAATTAKPEEPAAESQETPSTTEEADEVQTPATTEQGSEGKPLSESQPLEEPRPVDEPTAGEASDDLSAFPFNLALVSPVEVMPGAADRRIAMEVGLFFGRVGASSGVRIEGLVGVSRFAARGLGAGGLWLDTGADSDGVSVAGLVTRAKGKQNGLHAGGLAALAGGQMRGLQVGGLGATAGEQMHGLQMGGILTRADSVRGAQIGVVNIGGRVSGAQIGVVNFAREVKGAQIGVVNIAGDGRYQAVSWFDEQTTLHAGGRVMWGPLFGMLAFGVNPQGFGQQGVKGDGDGHYPLAFSYGFGGRVKAPALPRWMLELDLVYSTGLTTNGTGFTERALRQRAAIGFELSDAVTLLAGGGLKQRWLDNLEADFKSGPTFFAGVQLW